MTALAHAFAVTVLILAFATLVALTVALSRQIVEQLTGRPDATRYDRLVGAALVVIGLIGLAHWSLS